MIHSSEEENITMDMSRNVYTLRFGYCCYLDVNEEIIFAQFGKLSATMCSSLSRKWRIYPEDDGIPIPSRLYYRTMIVNAQTGEFMNPAKLKEKLLDCPEIITWEDVQ